MVVNKGDLIHYFNIKIYESGKVKKENKSYSVVACKENESYGELIVIDSYAYTIIQTKKEKYTSNQILNESSCYEMRIGIKYDNYINGYLYTTNPSQKIATKRIKKELEKFINEKYGRYSNYKIKLDEIQEND
jgi:hypothetical protein